MRKKYLSALLFGALLVASTGTFTSCKDYADDINDLQEQIDDINKKAPAITAEELKTAIDSAIKSLETSLNESLKGNTAEIEKLKGLVGDLDKALADKADKSVVEDILADIDDLASQVSGLDAAIKKCVQLTEFNALKSKVDALEEANKKFLTSADLDEYLTQEEISTLIDKKIVDEINKQISDTGEIYKLINNQISSAIASQVQGIYVTMEQYNQDVTELNKKLSAFAQESDLQALKARVSDLEQIDIEAVNSLISKKADIETLIGYISDIENLKNNTAGYLTAATLGDEIERYIDKAIKENDSAFYKLNEELKDLGLDIDSLKAMIQSIAYVPMNGTDVINISALYAKNGETWDAISNSEVGTVRFRVSPANAAEKFVKDYNVTLYSENISRSGSPITIEEIVPVEGQNGLVDIKLKAQDVIDNYAVCLHVEPKEGNTDKDTDITSDYFVINTGNLYLQKATYEYAQDAVPATEIITGDENSTIEYNKGAIKLEVTSDKDGNNDKKTGSLKDLNLPEDLLNVSFKMSDAANAEYFSIDENGVLSVTKIGAQATKETCQVDAVIKIAGNDAISYIDTQDAVTVKYIKTLDLGSEYAVDFKTANPVSGANQTISLNDSYSDLLLHLGTEVWAGITAENFGGEGIRFIMSESANSNPTGIYIFVRGGQTTGAEGKEITGVLKNGDNITVNIKAKVTVNLDLPAVVRNETQWRDNDIFIPFVEQVLRYDDLTGIFTSESYTALSDKVAAMGGELKFVEATETGLATFSEANNSKLTITPANYKGGEIKIKLQADFGSDVTPIDIEGSEANLKIFRDYNLSGNLNIEQAHTITFEKATANAVNNGAKVYNGAWTWTIVEELGGKAVSLIDNNGYETYGLKTDVIIEGEAAKWLEFVKGDNKTGFNTEIKVKDEIWNQTSQLKDGVEVDVRIEFTSPWWGISDVKETVWPKHSTVVKVKINTWNFNPTQN